MPEMDPSAAIEWMQKREAARIRKEDLEGAAACAREMGDDPIVSTVYTDDPIIHEYRFCNVRREDDRVTVWIRRNIRERFANHPHLWLMLCIARQVNWISTLDDLIGPHTHRGPYHGAWPSHDGFSPEGLSDALADRASMNLKVYTGAYIISAPSKKGVKKTTYTAIDVIGPLWRDREKFTRYLDRPGRFKKLSEVHAMLCNYNGWGPFLAYQAIVDMRFTSLLSDAIDVSNWCAAGPGTIRGLKRLMGETNPKPEMRQGDARTLIRKLEPSLRATGIEFDFSDIPNILCETDKFLRVRNGEGVPRAKYVPGRGY